MTILARPRVKACPGSRQWRVQFGSLTAKITQIDDLPGQPRFGWLVEVKAGVKFISGDALRWDTAFLAAWSSAARYDLPQAVGVTEPELRRLVERAEADPAQVLREVLHLRTGFRWSVRRGRGKQRDEIHIKARSGRLHGNAMTPHDAALLAALLDRKFVNPHHGATVRSDRRTAICSILGQDPDRLRYPPVWLLSGGRVG